MLFSNTYTGKYVTFADEREMQREKSVYSSIESLLNGFHQAAADGDFDMYFECFAENGTFLGTDASENWTVSEFMDYARPHFRKGRSAWTYIPYQDSRKIAYVKTSHTGPEFASFDELLHSPAFGCSCRGSGSAIMDQETMSWLIFSYHLSFPIPNESAIRVCNILANKPAVTKAKVAIDPEVQQAMDVAAEAEKKLLEELDEIDKREGASNSKSKKKRPKGKK
jgi:hypothetical protein